MTQPKTFYVLGAGASAGLVPFTADTRRLIRDWYFDLGMFPVTTARRSSPLHDRVARHPNKGEYGLPDLFLDDIPGSTLELLAQKVWSPPFEAKAPSQYAVLRRCEPGAIFSFNLDGLAGFYLRDFHLVFEPHGSVDRFWTSDPEFHERLAWSLDGWLPPIRPKILPGPEPSFITSTRAYLDARTHLRTATVLIILGYSFGIFGCRMDDIESFEYLIENQSRARSPILVVSPDPEPTVAHIEARLRCNRVRPIVIYWDIFSNVLNALMGESGRVSDWLPDSQLDHLLALYGRALAGDGRRFR
ncbi:MAG: hypothetical protein WD696_12980 [Bryobacteraceae bacterium]